jgi:hypothetical protein
VKNELSASEGKELELLYIALSQRARTINSIVARSQIEMMHDQGNLQDMRFFAKQWGGSITMETVSAAHDGAKLLNQEPMGLITNEHLQTIQNFIQAALRGGLVLQYSQTRGGLAALVIQHADRLDFIISLVVDREITDPDEISSILETAEDSPRPLTGGVL